MLSQRTIGKLQTFLELMYSRLGYGTPPALEPGTYYRLLYEANIRPELLDHIGKSFGFLPTHSIRALHEGRAIRWVNTNVDRIYSVSSETERRVGDTYVLLFAAVALRRYNELDYDYRGLFGNAAGDFLASLRGDGFTYNNEHIFDDRGNVIGAVPLVGSIESVEQRRKADPSSLTAQDAALPAEAEDPVLLRSDWSRAERIALATLVVTLFALAAAWLVVPEFRGMFHLDKSSSATSGATVPRSDDRTSSTEKQEKTRATPIFSVSDGHGKAVAGAEILVVKADGTHLKTVVTDEQGSGRLEDFVREPVTVFCSHPRFRHYSSEKIRLEGVFKIALQARSDGGSVIFSDGIGYVPGLDGRLNPILDNLGRKYLYAENIAIEGGEAQPVPFTLNRPFKVRDRHGSSFELDVISIIGNASLIEYTRTPRSHSGS